MITISCLEKNIFLLPKMDGRYYYLVLLLNIMGLLIYGKGHLLLDSGFSKFTLKQELPHILFHGSWLQLSQLRWNQRNVTYGDRCIRDMWHGIARTATRLSIQVEYQLPALYFNMHRSWEASVATTATTAATAAE